MVRVFFITVTVLFLMIIVSTSNGEEVVGMWLEANRFIEAKVGKHNQSLSIYLDHLSDGLKEKDPTVKIGDTVKDCSETKVNFGYQRGEQAYILGIGHLGEVRTDWEWPDGGKGYASFETYLADFILRHYFFGPKNPHPRGLVAYAEGGLGLCKSHWRFKDDKIKWIGAWIRSEGGPMVPAYFENPRLEGSNLGWHLGSGFDFYFNPDFSIGINGLYRWIYIENRWKFPKGFHLEPECPTVVQKDVDSAEKKYYDQRHVYFFDITREHRGLELDLSGPSFNIGLNLRF